MTRWQGYDGFSVHVGGDTTHVMGATNPGELQMLSPVLSAMREASRDEYRDHQCDFCGERGRVKGRDMHGEIYGSCADFEACKERGEAQMLTWTDVFNQADESALIEERRGGL